MSNSTNKTHVLVYPLQGQGHVIPILDFTQLLLSRGLVVTAIVGASDHALLDPLLSLHPSSLHKLVFPDPEICPFPYSVITKVLATQQLFDPIVQWFESHPSPPVAIISDFFLGWTNELAIRLGIRRVVFSPSGAFSSSIFHKMWQDIEKIIDMNGDRDDDFLFSFQGIPNSPGIYWWQLPPYSRSYERGEKDYESFRKGILANMSSWGIVFNTFEKLEGVYIDHMKKQMGHDRVWAIGPLLPDKAGSITTSSRGGSGEVSPDNLLMWLDTKQDDSVVYICFGTQFSLSDKQMSALANALELSHVNFVLCVKASSSSSIPNGFEDRVGGQGFIVKGWAPQLEVLRHRAVGSFMTHCGWNSSLEAISAGVMMLAWPMGADQFANAKLLVDQLGLGVRVCKGGPECVPDSIELARLLDESIKGDRPERRKVREVSEEGTVAVEGGTSIRDLDMFIKHLSEI